MKQALIIGGGSKNSQVILSTLLDNDFEIVNFGASIYPHPQVTNVKIAWDQLDIEFVQDNQSLSQFGAVRGLHFQSTPFEQGKLVRVIKGAVLDVVVDIRKNSVSFY